MDFVKHIGVRYFIYFDIFFGLVLVIMSYVTHEVNWHVCFDSFHPKKNAVDPDRFFYLLFTHVIEAKYLT